MTDTTATVLGFGKKTYSQTRNSVEKTVALARTGKEKAQQMQQEEPVATANIVRLAFLAGFLFYMKMNPATTLGAMALVETAITPWTRNKVSPRFHETE
jgi:hypothetical protein